MANEDEQFRQKEMSVLSNNNIKVESTEAWTLSTAGKTSSQWSIGYVPFWEE